MTAINVHVISKQIPKMYIHYDPKKNTYLADDTQIGACVFTENRAINFIRSGLQDPDMDRWLIEKLPNNVSKVPNDDSKAAELRSSLQKRYDGYAANQRNRK